MRSLAAKPTKQRPQHAIVLRLLSAARKIVVEIFIKNYKCGVFRLLTAHTHASKYMYEYLCL